MSLENTELTSYKELVAKIPQLKKEIAKVIVGQESVIEEIIITLLAGGHCLLEGVPGLAKTLMVNSLSQGMELNFKRIQFTPDLMPGDILGTEILEEDHETGKKFFQFNRGPIFANMVLADEINSSQNSGSAIGSHAGEGGDLRWAASSAPGSFFDHSDAKPD